MPSRWSHVVVDAEDPHAQARFWAAVLDWDTEADGDEVEVKPKGGDGTALLFVTVPEPKTVKNRLHIDLRPDDRDAEVERIVALGATRADVGQAGDESWVVLADPEGNELCVLRALP
jgi:predicted enzyme related to lactoylglutathione lyase